MRRVARLTPGKIAVLLTLGVAVAVVSIGGGKMFSPGALNADDRGITLGGVSSHAQLGGTCSACHVAPWSTGKMAGRCLDCHANVRQQIDARQAIETTFHPAKDAVEAARLPLVDASHIPAERLDERYQDDQKDRQLKP